MFAAAGWQVLTVKYGQLLEELFARPGGEALRARIDEMSNPEYQRLLRCTATPSCASGCPATARRATGSRALIDSLDDATLRAAIRNLGGHDLAALREAFDRDRRHPAHGDLRLHGQGLRAGRPRGTRRTTRRC